MALQYFTTSSSFWKRNLPSFIKTLPVSAKIADPSIASQSDDKEWLTTDIELHHMTAIFDNGRRCLMSDCNPTDLCDLGLSIIQFYG